MNTGNVKKMLLLAALAMLGGCATQGGRDDASMISAADFSDMINVEVVELVPLDAEKAVAANKN
jgi:uncharacterized lipoprotein YajG